MTASVSKPVRDPADVARLREDYEHFDSDSDGRLEYGEFARFLAVLRSGVSEQEQRLGFHEIDEDRDGTIDFDEFLEWWDAR
jgi:Ca2+-binding EF-hand superfamily protein